MKRRAFLGLAIAGGASVGLGAVWLAGEADHSGLSLEATLAKLQVFEGNDVISRGEWSPAQIFNHCAQSVEFSMLGFPEHKLDIFKQTVGPLALSVFSRNGSMTHGLSEVIPGAPLLTEKNNTQQALARLKQSLLDFKNFRSEFKPHFAYGELNKAEYSLAHVMHLNNHLEELSVVPSLSV